jgi:endonuclease YncB( thermonuclease family)
MLTKNYTIIDGDTIMFQENGTKIYSRARFIDCPEIQKLGQKSDDAKVLRHWHYGLLAKGYLANLLEGHDLIIENHEIDMFGRNLSDWYIDKVSLENNIQVLLIQEGFAFLAPPVNKFFFSQSELDLYMKILKCASIAYNNKIGIWQEEIFLPYEIRKIKS